VASRPSVGMGGAVLSKQDEGNVMHETGSGCPDSAPTRALPLPQVIVTHQGPGI